MYDDTTALALSLLTLGKQLNYLFQNGCILSLALCRIVLPGKIILESEQEFSRLRGDTPWRNYRIG